MVLLSVDIEEALYEVLRKTDLLAFKSKLAVEKQLTRIEHFQHVTDDELLSYGLSTPAIRRLRDEIEKCQKTGRKNKKQTKRLVKVVVDGAENGGERKATTSLDEGDATRPCIIARDQLKLVENIGEGTFAVIKHGFWRNGTTRIECAVKILHDVGEHVRADLFAEIANMQKLHHHNLIRLYGVVLGEPTLMVLEFCANGSLLDRLRSRTKERLLVTHLHKYSQQIANGMSYLESRRFVHRDLAARNVLLTENDEVVKICDFGLTRSLNENERLYVMNGPKKVPFAWCPPESLRYRQFSHKSDVWAFGVTLWELYTYGEEPWIGCNALDVLNAAEAGSRLRMPQFCSVEVYDIMRRCWCLSADERPKFAQLRNLLQDIKFTTAICRTGYASANEDALELQPDERVILIAEKDEANWFGQCMVSRRFGRFPRSFVTLPASEEPAATRRSGASNASADFSVRIKQPLALLVENGGKKSAPTGIQHRREISNPIPGSFIHTGHGDTDESKSWGYVEKIDEIYLRNAILGTTNFGVKNGARNHANGTSASVVPSSSALAWSESRPRSCGDESSALFVVDDIAGKMPAIINVMRGNGVDEWAALFGDTAKLSTGNATSLNGNTAGASAAASASSASTASHERPSASSSNGASPFEGLLQAPIPFSSRSAASTSSIKSSKYDSTISIPRPRRSSPVQRMNPRITPPLSASGVDVGGQFAGRRSQTSNGDGLEGNRLVSNSINKSAAIDWPNELATAGGTTANSTEKDPFIVEESVKSLALRKQPIPLFTTKMSIANGLAAKSAPTPNASVDILGSSAVGTLVNSDAITSTISHPNTSMTTTAASSTTPPESPGTKPAIPISSSGIATKDAAWLASGSASTSGSVSIPMPATAASSSSLLPPPSKLLLAGLSASAAIPMNAASSGGGRTTHFFPTNPSTFAELDPRLRPPPTTSAFFDFALPSGLDSARYQPIFTIGEHTRNGDVFVGVPQPQREPQNHRLRYGANGIPILEPTPVERISTAPAVGAPSTLGAAERPKVEAKNPTTVIDLQDLNTEQMIDSVRRAVDFATVGECRSALLRHDFDVAAAVRALKLERLLETGLITNRSSAAHALDAARGDVNEAANRLLAGGSQGFPAVL